MLQRQYDCMKMFDKKDWSCWKEASFGLNISAEGWYYSWKHYGAHAKVKRKEWKQLLETCFQGNWWGNEENEENMEASELADAPKGSADATWKVVDIGCRDDNFKSLRLSRNIGT